MKIPDVSPRQWFTNLSLRIKLTTFLIIILTGMTAVIFAVNYTVVSTKYREQLEHSAELSFSQAYDFIQKTIWPVQYAADVISSNKNVMEILAENAKQEHFDRKLDDQYRDMLTLLSVIRAAGNTSEFSQIRLFVYGSPMYAGQDIYFSSMDALTKQYTAEKLQRGTFWTPSEKIVLMPQEAGTKVVSWVRILHNPEDYAQVIGAVRVSIATDTLDEIIVKSNITEQGLVCLINSEGQVVCSSDHTGESELLQGEEMKQFISADSMGWHTVKLKNNRYYARSCVVENTDWQMIALVPLKEIREPARRIGMIVFAVMLLVIVLAGLAAFWFSGWFSKRLRVLSKNMLRVQQGNLDIEIDTKDEDEVGMLYESFNYMLEELKKYSRQQYENGKLVKSAEIRALQAQINPHFLYNTLDLINWMAIDYQVPKISLITQSLAKFYKLGLQKGKNVVTLSDELAHITEYVKIQNYRFEDHIILKVDVPQELSGCKIPKITLQPLVENAVLHGLMECLDSRYGIILINAQRQDGFIIVRISDDGAGMTPETLGKIQNDMEIDETSLHGYGTRNVAARLQLYYGEKSGLRYESTLGVGTTVTIYIPEESL